MSEMGYTLLGMAIGAFILVAFAPLFDKLLVWWWDRLEWIMWKVFKIRLF